MLYYSNITAAQCAVSIPMLALHVWPGGFGSECANASAVAWPATLSSELYAVTQQPSYMYTTVYHFTSMFPQHDTDHAAALLQLLVSRQIIGVPAECSVPVERQNAWQDSAYVTAAGILKHSPQEFMQLSFFETYMPLHGVTCVLLFTYAFACLQRNKRLRKSLERKDR